MPHIPNDEEPLNGTACVPCGGECYFLGCSVLGFNGSIGWNTQESSVTVDLIEYKCPPNEIQEFIGQNLIGYPVYFNCGSFFFGGLLQNWTYTENSGGKTYNVRIIDPRQILEQCVCITDTYAGPPMRTLNYFNVYGHYEESVYTNKNCSLFGTAEVTERGMPYTKIIDALKAMNPTICTPVGANLTIDWSTFDIPVPEYFKIAGPSITILQLVADICDEAGYDFFVTLEPGNIVRIYPVSIKRYDPIEDNLFFGFNNVIDFSYGKELRITKTRNLLFGEQQHYLDTIYHFDEDSFEFYFGEHSVTKQPVTPYKRQHGQFWVYTDIRKLNVSLVTPLPLDYVDICEYDIRTAMHSAESFWAWTENTRTVSELGKLIQSTYNVGMDTTNVFKAADTSSVNIVNGLADAMAFPNSPRADSNLLQWPPIAEDKQKIHEWVAEYGRTYYGRQYLVKLKEKVCIRPHPEEYGEKMYTDTPTNDGGWVEPGIPVLGLKDPELEMFRTDDGRVGAMALFMASGDCSSSGAYSGSGGGDYTYTAGSGEPPTIPENGGTNCIDEFNRPCSNDPQDENYWPGCSCE